MRTQCNVNIEIKVIRHKDKKVLGRVQCCCVHAVMFLLSHYVRMSLLQAKRHNLFLMSLV